MDDTESELAAIPESPKSDTTLHDSSGGSLGELEDSSALVGRSASMMMMMTRTSIPGGLFCKPETTQVAAAERGRGEGSISRPTWFLGSEEESHQVSYNSPSSITKFVYQYNLNQVSSSAFQKKWSVQEGVKMMVANTFLSGQHDFMPKTAQLPPEKALSIDSSTDLKNPIKPAPTAALAVTTIFPPTLRQDQTSPRDKPSPALSPRSENSDIPAPKHFGRQKNVDQTPPLSSPLSPNQIPPLLSDDSSSPAVSSMSSQPTSTENGSLPHPQHPILVAPTVERLLPIGTGTRSGLVRRVIKCEDTYGSPESPLSKMDVLTVSSSFEQDSETGASSDITSPRSMSQLEFPMPERLLPVGIHNQSVTGLVERVRQALGVPELPESSENHRKSDQEDRKPEQQDSIVSENLPSAMVTSRCASPRRLTKQVALESPPPVMETDDFCFRVLEHDRRGKLRDYTSRTQRERTRRGFGGSNHHVIGHTKRMDSWCAPQAHETLDPAAQQACHADFGLKQSLLRVGDECIYDRCSECGTIKEEYSDEELGLCIITLGTFIHREPALAAPLLPEILGIVTK